MVLARPGVRRILVSNKALSELLGQSEFADWQPCAASAIDAREGTSGVAKGAQAAMAVTSQAALAQMLETLKTWQLSPKKVLVSSFALAGAITANAKTGDGSPLVILECGEKTSQLLLVGKNGIVAAGTAQITLDVIAEAVRAELNLKFKGAASKLFFNEGFDFSESGPLIAQRLAESIKPDLAALTGGKAGAANAFLIAGLPAKQDWLTDRLAESLKLTRYTFDTKAWCTAAGITLGSEVPATLSPAWLGLLQAIRTPESNSWLMGWDEPNSLAPVSVAAAKPVAVAAAPAVTPAKTPAPAAPKSGAAAKVVTVNPAPAQVAAIKETPAAVALAKPTPAPAPKVAPAPKPATEPETPKQGSSNSGNKGAVATPKMSPPVSSSASYKQYMAGDGDTPNEKAGKSFFKSPLGLGLFAGFVVLLGITGWVLSQSQQQKNAALAESARLEQEAKVNAEKAQLAEKMRLAEAEARKRAEAEVAAASAKVVDAETARARAEAEARNQSAARLANARGALRLVTQPAGATVVIGNLPPQTSPVTLSDIKIGHYAVTVRLARHDEVKLEADVRENETTDLGSIALQRQVGALEIACDPDGTPYEVVQAGAMINLGNENLRGTTPAKLTNLDIGDYKVIFRRAGWPERTETVSVTRGGTAKVATKYSQGRVEISSTPAGAVVKRDGRVLGVTPLTLAEEPVGEAVFELSLPAYDPVRLTAKIEDGVALQLNPTLLATDRLRLPSELDEQPTPISPIMPEIPRELCTVETTVMIALIVDRTGKPRDLQITNTVPAEMSKICLATVAKWKFKPAKIKGRPVETRIVVPLKIAVAS